MLAQEIEKGAKDLGNNRTVGATDIEKAMQNFQDKFARDLSPDSKVDVVEMLEDPKTAVRWNSLLDSLKPTIVNRFLKEIKKRREQEGRVNSST